MDLQSTFSDAQAITGTAASENVIDLGTVDTPEYAVGPITRDLGRGRHIPILIQVVEDFATLTSLQVQLQTDDNDGFSSATTVASSEDVALADLVAGRKLAPFYVPLNVDERYVRLNYVVTGSNATAGKITAGLVFGRAQWTA
jgi:hypothetical protein